MTMKVILAPMEGVFDGIVRELLTAINDYELCITEFVRVSASLLPNKTFYRLCPELYHGGKTPSGTPVRVQLLGSSTHWLAENAVRAIELGSSGIDLNCGCPAKTVVGHDGGASLLKNPERIYQATKAIRHALPLTQPVSVKIRLGWDSTEHCHEIADAVAQAGATELTIHGRTKADGYRAESINWQLIGEIRQRLAIPVIANGEIWGYEDGQRCQSITGCDTLMVGRGALNIPNLSNVLKYQECILDWQQVVGLLQRYISVDYPFDSGFYHVARIKQWLSYLKQTYPEADILFRQIRPLQQRQQIADVLSAIAT